MTCPTTRRHPRSLAEAFPDARACAVEHYRAPRADRWAGFALAVAIGVALAFVITS
jgi:hypothetical protein